MKGWLTQRFLPLWAKETVLRENKALQRENRLLQARVRELECYIRGVHRGLGSRRPQTQRELQIKN